jgi:hypothetical protein
VPAGQRGRDGFTDGARGTDEKNAHVGTPR